MYERDLCCTIALGSSFHHGIDDRAHEFCYLRCIRKMNGDRGDERHEYRCTERRTESSHESLQEYIPKRILSLEYRVDLGKYREEWILFLCHDVTS